MSKSRLLGRNIGRVISHDETKMVGGADYSCNGLIPVDTAPPPGEIWHDTDWAICPDCPCQVA